MRVVGHLPQHMVKSGSAMEMAHKKGDKRADEATGKGPFFWPRSHWGNCGRGAIRS